jgi:hypothetical protein
MAQLQVSRPLRPEALDRVMKYSSYFVDITLDSAHLEKLDAQIQKCVTLSCQMGLGRAPHSSQKLASLVSKSKFRTMIHSFILRYSITWFTEFVKP